jgi:hypothetical protein
MCRKFRKDFGMLVKLDLEIKGHESHLEDLAKELQDAQRRLDPKAKSMRKDFKRIHQVLLAFGRCNHREWENYFPTKSVIVQHKMQHH